jgi:HupE / UreJ protein
MRNLTNWFLALTPLLLTAVTLMGWESAAAHGISAAERESILSGGLLAYLKLGAIHMLTGYDHLLFLFGVIFFLTRFQDILRFITAFTLGHCITLVLATFLQIQANYVLVDAAIALTVCYKAFENLDGFSKYLDIKAPNLTFMVFGFGLLHGFGLSSRLQEIVAGTDNLLPKILMFNLGVEVGQVAALAVMWLLLSRWRTTTSFKKFATVTNLVLLAAGTGLFLIQAHGYVHLRGLMPD